MKPRVILHNAVSLDGRMDWIAPDLGQFYAIVAPWKEDATLVGSNTLLQAPEEIPLEDTTEVKPPVPDPADKRPWLIVPDSRGRIHSWHHWRAQPYWRDVIVLVSTLTKKTYLTYLKSRHINYIIAGTDHVDFKKAFHQLYTTYNIKTIRVDSGGTLNGALLRAGLVDDLNILIYPSLVGGTSQKSLFHAPDLTTPEGVIACTLKQVKKLKGNVIWLAYKIKKQKP